MKKILIAVAIVILVVLTILTLVMGIHIGNFEIFGLSDMKQKNDQIDTKVTQLSKLTGSDFPKKMSELNSSAKELLKIKEDYADLTNYSSETENNQANELPEYEVEFLWAKVGEHGTKEGIDVKMDISNAAIPTSPDGRKLYNLNFTATGSYIGIAQFVSALENDSFLEFKIESFKMLPTDNGLQATFTVKDVPIKLNNLSAAPANNTETQNQTKQNTTNTTGNAAGNTTANTAGTANTTAGS